MAQTRKTSLSAAEEVRADSWMLDIAIEKRGRAVKDTERAWRVGPNRALRIGANGSFYDHTAGVAGHGVFQLVTLLHPGVDADAFVKQWLSSHPGRGQLPLDDNDEADDADDAEGDAERTAMIEALRDGAPLIDGATIVDHYLRVHRDLDPCVEDRKIIHHLPNARGDEDAMLVEVLDADGKLVAVQLTHLNRQSGEKSAVKPVRMTLRGPHDWNLRGLVRFGKPGVKAYLFEGVEDALSGRAGGADCAIAYLGVARIGKVPLSPETEIASFVRDDDALGSKGEAAGYRAYVRLLGQLPSASLTPAPSVVAGDGAPRLKDINDLHRFNSALVNGLLNSTALPPQRLVESTLDAILDEVSRVSATAYDKARKKLQAFLRLGRLKGLDDERERRRRARAQRMERGESEELEEEEPWPDPITDIGALLDEIVIILRRYIVMEERHFHSVALWIVLSHLLQRVDLGVNVAPRLAIQSPAPDCGKTTLLMLVACGVPRARMAGDISPASLFRLVDALHVSLLLDEADNMFNGISDQLLLQVVNSGHRRKTAFIERVDTLPDGTKKTVRFSTFTAIAYAGIKELPPTQQTRCVAIKLQAATAAESKKIEHLVDDDSPEMRVICRKLNRWSADLKELPKIDRPVELLNRLGDNWYPMRQIAKLAGGAWPQRAFNAAQESKVNPGDKGDLPALLASIYQLFREPPIERLQTGEIVQKLLAEPEGPWREKHKGKPINEYYLRDSLREVIPKEKPDLRKWKEGVELSGGITTICFWGRGSGTSELRLYPSRRLRHTRVGGLSIRPIRPIRHPRTKQK
jgi:hypothetical protein